ncbi:GTPase [Massilia timonae]|uniref:GTPase n=1 Tax=Massilia timonae TaxID=47229 RepID=UPI00289ABEFD|nr:GTPase [Massilia timonae]
MNDNEYKIALVGPTRVGKTSLISSILAEAQTALAGTPASLKAKGSTFARISDNVNELAGALAHGEFRPDAITSSTSDLNIYELALEVGKSSLPLRILDYPGGWLNAREPESQWNKCAEWIEQSNVLILPVDAVVAMECATVEEGKACHLRLRIDQVTQVVREWAKARVAAEAPGTIILVPVKCETYLVAPGATRATADKLRRRLVEDLYEDMFVALAAEFGGSNLVSAYYAPVNTIGCVDLVDAGWEMAEDRKLECHPSFRVLPPAKRKVEGALDVLILFARSLASAENERKRNPVATLWRYLTGERRELRAALERLDGMKLSQRAQPIRVRELA